LGFGFPHQIRIVGHPLDLDGIADTEVKVKTIQTFQPITAANADIYSAVFGTDYCSLHDESLRGLRFCGTTLYLSF